MDEVVSWVWLCGASQKSSRSRPLADGPLSWLIFSAKRTVPALVTVARLEGQSRASAWLTLDPMELCSAHYIVFLAHSRIRQRRQLLPSDSRKRNYWRFASLLIDFRLTHWSHNKLRLKFEVLGKAKPNVSVEVINFKRQSLNMTKGRHMRIAQNLNWA